MWHQARKQEKKLRCLMVDYKKRAERRRTYYELCVSNCIKKNSYDAKKRWKRGVHESHLSMLSCQSQQVMSVSSHNAMIQVKLWKY